MLGVTIGEGKIASPVMPDGGQVHPQVAFGIEAEMAVVDAQFMLVEKNKRQRRQRSGDLRGCLIYAVALLAGENQTHIPSVHVTVDGITPDAGIADTAKNRTSRIGWAAVNRRGFIVGK